MLDIAAELELQDLYMQQKWVELARRPELAGHPEWVTELYAAQDSRVHRALAGNPAIAAFPEIVAKLAANEHSFARSAIDNAFYSRVALESASTQDLLIRVEVAKNPEIANFPPDVVEKLATDKNWQVSRALYDNPAFEWHMEWDW